MMPDSRRWSLSMPDSSFDGDISFLCPDVENFSAERWARHLESIDAKRFVFLPLPLPRGYFGARLIVVNNQLEQEDAATTEYICYADWLPAVQAEHVKAHELAHSALNHPTLILSESELEGFRANASDPRLWRLACCRASNPLQLADEQLAQDQEAERLARLIYQRKFGAREKKRWGRNSSQDDMDGFFHRLGID